MKKIITLAAVILLAAMALSLVSCGGSKGSSNVETAYKVLTHSGNQSQDEIVEDLHISSDNRFSLAQKEEYTEADVTFYGIMTYYGTVTYGGDTATCTVTEVGFSYEFSSNDDKAALLADLESSKGNMSEDEYNKNYKAVTEGMTMTPDEMKEQNMQYYPAEFVVKLDRSAKTAVMLSDKLINGNVETYEYYDDEPGLIKSITSVSPDGSSYTYN